MLIYGLRVCLEGEARAGHKEDTWQGGLPQALQEQALPGWLEFPLEGGTWIVPFAVRWTLVPQV